MREVEFLPAWYPTVHRRKRALVLQTWITLLIAVVLGLWVMLTQRNVKAAQASLGCLQGQISQTETELRQLDEELSKQRQLEQKLKVMRKVGVYVPASRMINAVDAAMPKEMSLVDLTLETEETTRAPDSKPAPTPAGRKSADAPQFIRRLKVKLDGLAPTDIEIVAFIGELTANPLFEQIDWKYSKDSINSGHIMRQFEVTFSMNLTPGEEN